MSVPNRRVSRRDMEAIGLNIGDKKSNLAAKRKKKGECPTCGIPTHKVGMFGRKPLTVPGEVRDGTCLKCNPIEGYARRPTTTMPEPPFNPHASGPPAQRPPTRPSAQQQDLNIGMAPQNPINDHFQDFVAPAAPGPARVRRDLPNPTFEDGPPSRFPRDIPDNIHSSIPRIITPVDWDDATEITMDFELSEAYRRQQMARDHGMSGHFDAIEEETVPPLNHANRAPEPSLYPDDARPNPNPPKPPGRPGGFSSSARVPSRPPFNPYAMDQVEEEVDPRRELRDVRTGHEFRRTEGPSSYPRSDIPLNEPRDLRMSAQPQRSLRQGPREQQRQSYRPSPPVDYPSQREHVRPEIRLDLPSPPSEPGSDEKEEEQPGAYATGVAYAREPPQARSGMGELTDNFGRVDLHAKPEAVPGPPEFRFVPTAYQDNEPDPQEAYHNSWPAANKPPAARRPMPDDDDHGNDRDLRRASASARNFSVNVERMEDSPVEPTPREVASIKPSSTKKNLSVTDITTIIHSLNLDVANTHLREAAFKSLTEIIWKHGQKAKIIMAEHHGIETLVKSMWDDMANAAVQEAATELLFALAASSDGDSASDILVGDQAEGAVDALLIVMQHHASIEVIQRHGCGALYCLAAASSANRRINDGSLSGAVFCVANAMDVHRTSKSLQEVGLRALYSECVLSVNAESNKSSLSSFENAGVDLMSRALQVSQTEVEAAAWACRLYWCFSAGDAFAKRLYTTRSHVDLIVDTVRLHQGKPESASLMEAAFGVLSNIGKHEESHGLLLDVGVVPAVVDSFHCFHTSEGVLTECCALIANLATNPDGKDAILRTDAVDEIARAIEAFPLDATLQEEALRALVSLSIEDVDTKMRLASEEVVTSVMQAVVRHDDSLPVQVLAFSLLSSLSSHRPSAASIVSHGVIPTTIKVMKTHPKDWKLQEAVSMIWRNLTSYGDGLSEFVRRDAMNACINVMSAQSSQTVQVNFCCAIWNLSNKADPDHFGRVIDAGTMEAIVKAMQAHLENASVVEMACGALWSLIDDSVELQKVIVSSGGIDAVSCALVMHPQELRTLEMACGVLSNVSATSTIAKAVTEANGLTFVVETMRNNPSEPRLLEFGALIIRNIVLINPDSASEASGGVSTLLTALKEHDDPGFQKEACTALWAMAAQSDECKSKILALDGVHVLMETMANGPEDVEEAARGAFNQLSVEGGE